MVNPNICSAEEWLTYKGWTVQDNGCWETNVGRDPDGYGITKWAGVHRRIHILTYMVYRGEIPPRFVVRHKCDNPPCVNPDHLELGTNYDNIQDRVSRGRSARGESSGTSKLKIEEVRQIHDLCASRLFTLAKIGEWYGVSDAMIGMIKRGKAWAHVYTERHNCKEEA